MGMWDWYNRPGGRARLSTRTVALVMIISGIVTSILIWIIYALLAPIMFSPIPPR
jgi:hypothetical protein